MNKKSLRKLQDKAARYVHRVRGLNLECQMVELVGKRCPDFAPGCAVCDMWEAWDLGAYGHVKAELEDTLNWIAQG